MPQLHTIHFNSTKTCNLACAFCYDNAIKGYTANLEIKVIKQLAKDAAECGGKRVILSGGEPLTRKDWNAIAREFDAYNMEISLATNGTLISSQVVDFLKSLNHPTLSISIDGGESVHNRLRGSSTAFQRTLNGIKLLHKSDIPFHINCVLFETNISEIGILTKLAREFNCPVRLTLLHNNGRADTAQSVCFNAEAIIAIREYCHLMRQNGINIFLNLPPLLQYVDEIIPTRGVACGWAENFCGILANGDVTICGVASNEPGLVAGNIINDRFMDIWQNAELFSRTRSYSIKKIKGICGRCPFNELCGGACRLSAYRNTGDFFSPYGVCQYFYDAGFIPENILEPEYSPVV